MRNECLGALLSGILCTACSSIKSTPYPDSGSISGLTYYMPKKDFLVTVVKSGGKITSVTLGNTSSYPDIEHPFVLNHALNLVGKNTLNIGVGTSGLLTSSKSTTTSGIPEALTNLAGAFGALHGLGAAEVVAPPAPPKDTCAADGTNTFLFKNGVKDGLACGLSINITKVGPTIAEAPQVSRSGSDSGLYYRQAEPYFATATGSINASAVVFSPSLAPTRFLPVSKTLFSNNAADFEFEDGMPTKYNQDTDGELVALFKLPADVIGAYFSAVGKVFDSFKANSTNQADVLAATTKLELAKKKYDACLAAISAKDDTTIDKLQCGK